MIEELLRKNEDLENELARLREQCSSLQQEKESLEQKYQSALSKNKWLEDRLRILIERLYGRRSEKLLPGQLSLPFLELAQEAKQEIENETKIEQPALEKEPQRRRSGRHGRRPLPENLPRVREEILPQPQELVCGLCGKEKQRIGEEITEELEYDPGRFYIRELVRVKFGCHDCMEGVTTPPLPPRPIEKGRPGLGLLAHIAVSKYGDHLPLYRQEQIFARQGLNLCRTTLCDWMGQSALLLVPIVKEMRRFILSQPVVQSDDTHVQVRDAETKRATRRGYLWVYCIPWGEVVYDFTLSRGQEGPLAFLEGFRGYLQTDAYGAYNEIFRRGHIIHLGCFAHARRKYYEARKEAPRETDVILAVIQSLYRIERAAKEAGLIGEPLVAVRRERESPILDELKDLLIDLRPRVLPQSRLGQAIQYTLSQWEALVRYVDIGEAEIDNNSAESSLRNVVLGRKNWLFLGNAEGGGLRATVLYSLVESCKRLKVDPFAYLKDVIHRVSVHPASRIWELTPRGWKETIQGRLTPAGTAEPP